MESLEETNETFRRDQTHARANQYLGWWWLDQDLDSAIHFLEQSGVMIVTICKNATKVPVQIHLTLRLGIFSAGPIFNARRLRKHTVLSNKLSTALKAVLHIG